MTLISNHPSSQRHFPIGLQFSRSPADASSGSCRSESGIGAFANQIALKCGQRPHQMEDEFAAWGRGIDLLGETNELDAAFFEALEHSIKWVNERPTRSSFHTTKVSG